MMSIRVPKTKTCSRQRETWHPSDNATRRYVSVVRQATGPMNITPLSAEEFARAWGGDALVRLPTNAVATARIPQSSRDFLTRAGLPALIHYFLGSTDAKMTFVRLEAGLRSILEEKTVGTPLSRTWSAYRVLGEEFFCNGSAWWCEREPTGEVCRVDIELSQPVSFVNSSVEHFASAILAARHWSEQYAGNLASELDRLRDELRAFDPHAMADERHFWPKWLDFIEFEKDTLVDAGVRVGEWRIGTRADGERALREGPW